MRDLRQLYHSLAGIEALKNQVDLILAVKPGDIQVQFSLPGVDLNRTGVSYLDISNPASAARIIGMMNSAETLLEHTDHFTLLDSVLAKRISEATAIQEQ